jgi:hypothetical protein
MLPVGEFLAASGQRTHRGAIHRLEGRAPAPFELLEGTGVELRQRLADRDVELARLKKVRLRSAAMIQR